MGDVTQPRPHFDAYWSYADCHRHETAFDGLCYSIQSAASSPWPSLLVEQNVREALDLADRGHNLQTGRITGDGTGQALLNSDLFRSAFLGI